MSQDINKEAFKQAEKELLDSKVQEIKGYVLKTLEKIESKKKEKEKIEEQLRILKMDLENLRNGDFEKIEERLEKSKAAREATAIELVAFHSSAPVVRYDNQGSITQGTTLDNTFWNNATSGTYTVSVSGIDIPSQTKTFYF